MDFLSTLGNVNPANIEEQYGRLAESMNPALRVRFQAEAGDWAGRVRRDNISEVMSVTRKEIKTDGLGTYHVKAFARCDTYAGSEVLGARNEVIEMDLVLVPPRADRRWFLEITSLTRSSEKTYQARLSMQEKPHE